MTKAEKYIKLAVENGHAKSCKCPKCGKHYLRYKTVNLFKEIKHDCFIFLGLGRAS